MPPQGRKKQRGKKKAGKSTRKTSFERQAEDILAGMAESPTKQRRRRRKRKNTKSAAEATPSRQQTEEPEKPDKQRNFEEFGNFIRVGALLFLGGPIPEITAVGDDVKRQVRNRLEYLEGELAVRIKLMEQKLAKRKQPKLKAARTEEIKFRQEILEDIRSLLKMMPEE